MQQRWLLDVDSGEEKRLIWVEEAEERDSQSTRLIRYLCHELRPKVSVVTRAELQLFLLYNWETWKYYEHRKV